MNANNNLFISILSTIATTDAVMASLRETIFWTVVNATAMNIRVSESLFANMKQTAEIVSGKTSAEFYCDSRVTDMFSFAEGNSQHQLKTIQKLYDVIIQYHAWYEDIDGNEDGVGFCWQYNSHHYRLIFR